jgi:glutamyl-tRNA reductase
MIILKGLSHKTAPVNIRGCFAFNEEEIPDFVNSLKAKPYVRGGYLLSTCNRTEIYLDVDSTYAAESQKELAMSLSEHKEKADAKYFYEKTGIEAAGHFFRVAAGLESMALGEDQVLGQIKEALRIAEEAGTLTPTLLRMVHKGQETGKKVRSRTAINEGAASISYAAVELASEKISHLKERRVLLIGAGKTGELAIQSFMKRGCKHIWLANRTRAKADKMADKYHCRVYDFKDIGKATAEFDIIMTSTSSRTPLITRELISQYSGQETKPLYLFDLSVPSNIPQNVHDIHHVQLYDIDSLEQIVSKNFEKRKGEVRKAEAISEDLIDEFSEWLDSQKLKPLIRQVQENFRNIHEKELEGFKDAHRPKPENYEIARQYGQHISEKYIRMLIKNMRHITRRKNKDEYLNLINELFEISPDTK